MTAWSVRRYTSHDPAPPPRHRRLGRPADRSRRHPRIKAAGFVAIVNNRPDDEEAGQPGGDAIRAAAEDHGLAYTAIPVTHAGFSHPQLDAMAAALAEANGPVLAYCRSGTRSCNLWALAGAKAGADPAALVARGGSGGV